MEQGTGQDGGDQEPATPVASLRSRFEFMTAAQPVTTIPSRPHVRQSSQALDVPVLGSNASTPRQSLDIPYRSHQRTASETSERRIPPEPPKPRRRVATPPPVSRPPAPTPSATPAKSPPRVNVTSPKSPPKHIDSHGSIPLSLNTVTGTKPTPPSPRLLTSGTGFRIPSRSVSPENGETSSLRPRSPRGEAGNFKFPPAPASHESPATTPASKTSKASMGPPPPVNRAAKARVVSTELVAKPTMAQPQETVVPRGRQDLSVGAPPRATTTTTPAATGLDGSSQGYSRPPPAAPSSSNVLHFDRPPTHHQVANKRRQASIDMGLGHGGGGIGSQQGKHVDSPAESRPQLPPRRDLAVTRPSVDIPARISSDLVRPPPLEHSLRTPTTSTRDRTAGMMPPPSPRSTRGAAGTHNVNEADSNHTFVLPEQLQALEEYPDSSTANRRPPYYKDSPKSISTTYDLRLVAVCGEYVCCTGTTTRVWSILTGKLILSMTHGEGVKITALCFRPSRDSKTEGNYLWLGTNLGEILEVDISLRKTVSSNNELHARREIIRIYRHAAELWSLDDEGKLVVWPVDAGGSPVLSNGALNPRLPRGHTASLVIDNHLWLATGKEIRVFQPSAVPSQATEVTEHPLIQQSVGEIATAAVSASQSDLIYFGHTDGMISVYSRKTFKCQHIFNVSTYKVACLVGVGRFLWAGYSSGVIHVYDTTTRPWTIKKEWKEHAMPVVSIVADRSSIWTLQRLQVVSLGMDNVIKIWDGILQDDWIDDLMHERDSEYCTFKDMTSLVMTWNAGASKPTDLRYDEKNSNFFREMLQAQQPPDVIVFGLQEIVDLEDKRLTAKTFFKGKKQDALGNEQLSSAYRAWRDYFSRCIEEHMPPTEAYTLLHSVSLVGLFTCIFIKSTHRTKIRDVYATEVKTGMGGLHGNKGALVVRFLLDDASLCFVNCHLAAGQNQAMARNHDITSILTSTALPPPQIIAAHAESFSHGGNGTMIMDHEICVVNGDLNYRLDSITREMAVHGVESGDFAQLLEHDQLLQARRRDAGFVLRAFHEEEITFRPTYKYDVGTDRYDTSEKKRIPAWCDRILYRGSGDKVKQTEYKRHEVKVSDHRAVSARFDMRIKTIQAGKRMEMRRRCEQEFVEVKRGIVRDAMCDYLVSVYGMTVDEARKQLQS